MKTTALKVGRVSGLICLLLVSQLLGQEDRVKTLESQLASVEAERAKLVESRDNLISGAVQLSIEIEELKEKTRGKNSLFDEYKLQGLLKDSNTLSHKIYDLNLRIANTDVELKKISSDLVTHFDNRVNELILRIEQSSDLELDERLFQQILKYREERRKIRQKYTASKESTEYLLPNFEIAIYDGPVEIEEKAD